MVVDRFTNYIAENPGDGTANPDQGNDGDDDTTPPASTETLANGEPATVENVLAMLDEIKEKYPQGTPWTVANSYYSPAFGTNSTGCAAYAYTVSDLIFGDLPVRKHTDYSSIKPGDVLEIKNSSGQTFTGLSSHRKSMTKGGSKPQAAEAILGIPSFGIAGEISTAKVQTG